MTVANIREIGVMEMRRSAHSFYESASFTSTSVSDAFYTKNMTGCVLWVKATSATGTPNFTITLETNKDDTNANYVQVNASSLPSLPVTINDEIAHIVAINFAQMHEYARFKITLNVGDGGDDVLTMRVCFLYGEFAQTFGVFDANGALLVNMGAINSSTDSITTTTNQTTIGNGHKEVTTAGTAVALASSTSCKRVTIQAYRANTGVIIVGGTGVNGSSSIGTGTGASLAAGESISFDINNLATIFIDSTVNGEGVRYIYLN